MSEEETNEVEAENGEAEKAREVDQVFAAAAEKLKRDEQGRYIVPLSTPIERKSSTITELRFREPRGRDVRHMSLSKQTLDGIAFYLAERCGTVNGSDEVVTAGIVDNLGLRDVGVISALMQYFFQPVVQMLSD